MKKYIKFILENGYTEKAKIIFPINTQFYNGQGLAEWKSKQKAYFSPKDENKKWIYCN